jgi:hypothetical protein
MEPRARLELAFPDYKSGASPTMLTGLVILEPMERIERSSVAYHATALPLSYIGWSQRGYSKPRPPRYGCGALPLELLRRITNNGASAENRTPFVGQAIGCPTNSHTRRNSGADGDNRNLFSGLEAQGTPYIPRPLVYQFRAAIQLSKTSIETHFYCVASKRKRVRQYASIYR